MGRWHFAFFVALSAQCATAVAQSALPQALPAKRQLIDLNASEASALLAKVKDAQRRLKAGGFVSFELLAGSVASYDATNISPRHAFLAVPFDDVWDIKRVHSDNPLWQPYRLAYAPNGLGHLYWDIEVVLAINGDIERVLMTYKPPAPF